LAADFIAEAFEDGSLARHSQRPTARCIQGRFSWSVVSMARQHVDQLVSRLFDFVGDVVVGLRRNASTRLVRRTA
jgi:hypothetical protein